jgi:hypothetical protein
METMGDLVVSFIRLQEQADREREKCLEFMASPGHENEAAKCRKKAASLQKEASNLLGKYKRIKTFAKGHPSC